MRGPMGKQQSTTAAMRNEQVFRNGAYPVLGTAMITAGVVAVAVAVVVAHDVAAIAVVAVIGALFASSGWIAYIRPRVVADDTGVTVVNPTRTVQLAWSQIERFHAGRLLYIVPRGRDQRQVAAWAVQAANLARMLGRTSHADRVASDLNRLLVRHRKR